MTDRFGTTRLSEPNRFDEERRRFYAAWAAGEAPQIEQYLDFAQPEHRPQLLRELLAVELHELHKSGGRVEVEEYVSRFPQYAQIVREQCQALDSFSSWLDSTVARAHAGVDDTQRMRDQVAALSETVSRYRLIELLGRGGFGEVWRAYDEKLQTEVAIKAPRRDRPVSAEAAADLLEEARKIRRMKCSGFVPVLDVVEADGFYFIVMELMEGGSLRPFTDPESLRPHREVAAWAAEIAAALHQAHLLGYVHRDIKPANILLDRFGKPFVADLGLAVSEEEQLAEHASVVGTLKYMSPEQVHGQSNLVDARTDIYSLGVLMYHMLTGRPPYLANNLDEYRRLLDKPGGPRPLRTIDDGIPAELERICLKCLAKDVQGRYTTARDLSHDLHAWLDARPDDVKRRGWLAAAAFAVVSVGLLLAATSPWWLGRFFPPIDRTDGHSKTPAPIDKVTAEKKPPPKSRFFEDLAAENIKREVWYPLLNRRPPVLHGVDQPPFLTLTHDPELRILTLNSKRVSLLSLGTARGRDYSVEIEMSQSRWYGGFGLFVGYQKTGGEFGSQARLHLLRVQKSGQAPPRPTLAMGRVTEWIRDTKNRGVESVKSTEVGIRLIEPAWKVTAKLELMVRGGILADVKWCGKSVTGLCGTELEEKFELTPQDYQGEFGIYTFSSDAVFQSARVKFH